jgi:hypothetical protein
MFKGMIANILFLDYPDPMCQTKYHLYPCCPRRIPCTSCNIYHQAIPHRIPHQHVLTALREAGPLVGLGPAIHPGAAVRLSLAVGDDGGAVARGGSPHDLRNGGPERGPHELVLVAAALEAVAQPDAPDNVEVGPEPRHQVPAVPRQQHDKKFEGQE